MNDVALIVPCFNEAARLDADAFEVGVRASGALRLLFVDDGSTDDTGRRLAALADRLGSERCSILTLESNFGKAEAVRRGIVSAFESRDRGRDLLAVGFWDADLSTPLGAVRELASVLEEHPETMAVVGSRIRLMGRHIDRHTGRHYAGRVFASLASAALGFPVYDTQCGAKLFRATGRMRTVFDSRFKTRWAFDVELLARLANEYGMEMGLRGIVVEYPLMRWTDVPGSKVRLSHLPRMVLDLGRIHRARRAHRGLARPAEGD